MQLRIIIVAACILLLTVGVGYKFHEYQHLKTLVDTYESVLIGKLSFIEEFDNRTEEAHEQFKTYYSQKPDTLIEETLSNLDNIIRSAKLVQGYVQDYEKKIEQDREKFQNIKNSRLLLIGPAKGFSNKLLDSIDNYYQEEIKTARNNDIGSDFTINLYETLKDYHIALNHGKASAKLSNEKIAASFYEISSLEKYARDDFSFRNEGEIKKSMYYEYEILTKYRQYLKSYYIVLKDYASGNYESAAYKITRLVTDASNLTVDWERIGKDTEPERIRRGKTILDHLITQLTLFRDLKQKSIGAYPYLDEIEFSKKDLLLCHVYSYKKWVYHSVTSKYPEAKTIEDLFKEYSKVSPRTNEFDNEVDKDSVQYTNTDEKIEFVCKDKDANKSYSFPTSK